MLALKTKRYHEWLQAPPVQRFYIIAPSDEDLPTGFDWLKQRMSSMLLAAIPVNIKEEVISTRQIELFCFEYNCCIKPED